MQQDDSKPLIFQTLIVYITHILKYQQSTTSGCNDLGIIKLIFVIIAQLLIQIDYTTGNLPNWVSFISGFYFSEKSLRENW